MMLRSHAVRLEPSNLRTSGGLEADLVLENQTGPVAIEMKLGRKETAKDPRPIGRARRLFGDSYLGSLVVYRGHAVAPLTETVFAVPDFALLGL